MHVLFSSDPTPTPVNGVKWPMYTRQNPKHLEIRLPPKVVGKDLHWPSVAFWNTYVPYIAKFAATDDITAARYAPLTDEERLQLNAYKRAWWALWLLVAAIALLLWTIVICMVARKCMTTRSKPYHTPIIVSNNR